MSGIIVFPQVPTIRETVQQGAAFLDQHVPEWAKKIDIYTLNMRDMQNCILGQLFGDWANGLAGFGNGWNWISEHGFILLYDTANENDLPAYWKLLKERYLALTEMWREEVTKRL